MFELLCMFCLWVFFIQGALTPVLIVWAGFVTFRQDRKLDALAAQLKCEQAGSDKKDSRVAAVLSRVPRLEPLKCPSCGGGVLLGERDTTCPHCGTHGALPPDYLDAGRLQRYVRALLKSALHYWWVARVLTLRPVAWLFTILIFAEPAMLFFAFRAAFMESSPRLERAFDAMGKVPAYAITASGMFSFFIWMIVFLVLVGGCRSLRRQLPAYPRLPHGASGAENANCQSCGGGIAYDRGAFVCICPWCGVENYRAQFVQREHAGMKLQRTDTKSVIFGAMRIVEDFVSTFFYLTAILGVAAIGVVIMTLLKERD